MSQRLTHRQISLLRFTLAEQLGMSADVLHDALVQSNERIDPLDEELTRKAKRAKANGASPWAQTEI